MQPLCQCGWLIDTSFVPVWLIDWYFYCATFVPVWLIDWYSNCATFVPAWLNDWYFNCAIFVGNRYFWTGGPQLRGRCMSNQQKGKELIRRIQGLLYQSKDCWSSCETPRRFKSISTGNRFYLHLFIVDLFISIFIFIFWPDGHRFLVLRYFIHIILYCYIRARGRHQTLTGTELLTIYWPMILMAPCTIDFIGANALLGPVRGGGGGPGPLNGIEAKTDCGLIGFHFFFIYLFYLYLYF